MSGAKGRAGRKMPGGAVNLDSSGSEQDQGNGNEKAGKEGEADHGETEVGTVVGEETGVPMRNDGQRGNGLRTRSHATGNEENIPATASIINTPGDARKYANGRLGKRTDDEIDTDTLAKLLEQTLAKKYACGNKELVDTIQATKHLLKEIGRSKWVGGKKEKEAESEGTKESTLARKYRTTNAQTDDMGKGVNNDIVESNKDAYTDKDGDNDTGNENLSLSFADEVKLEVRKAIEGAMTEAQKRVEHFTSELDKRIEFMYNEQIHIKEAHEIGLATAKAGLRLTEQKSKLVSTQMEATLGIIADTEKRVERLGWYMQALEGKQKRREDSRKGKGKGRVQEQEREQELEKKQEEEVTGEKSQDEEDKGSSKQGPKNNGKNEKGNEKGRTPLALQGPKKNKEVSEGFEADGEESERDRRPAATKTGKTETRTLVPATMEWGGWEDLQEISSFDPSIETKTRPSPKPSTIETFSQALSPPPPNQMQIQQRTQNTVETKTRNREDEKWTEVISRAATHKAMFERVREKDCQVFIDLKIERGQADVWKHKAGRDLTIKANEVINIAKGFDGRGKPEGIMIWGAHRIGEGKYIFDVNSPVGANWLKADGNRETFAKGLAEGAIVVLRSYPVIVKFAPITFDVDDPTDLREIVRKAQGASEHVISARWIKDPAKRGPNQKFAFLIVEIKTPETANAIIANGAYVHGKKCEAKKYKADAVRCNKCQRYGHVTATCRTEKPTCGQCAKEHWTSQCDFVSSKIYCINCRTSEHAARDLRCPVLEEKTKLQARDKQNPDRKLKYYPTTEVWTHEILTEYSSGMGNRDDDRRVHLQGTDL